MMGRGKVACWDCKHRIPTTVADDHPSWIGTCGWPGVLPAWAAKEDASQTARWIWNGAGAVIVSCATFELKEPR